MLHSFYHDLFLPFLCSARNSRIGSDGAALSSARADARSLRHPAQTVLNRVAHGFPKAIDVHASRDVHVLRLGARPPAVDDGLAVRQSRLALDVDAFVREFEQVSKSIVRFGFIVRGALDKINRSPHGAGVV